MKKGFTLIELLAVIVILAIIALIAVPIILNIIKDSKEKSNMRSAEMYKSAVEKAVARYSMTKEFPNTRCDILEGGNLDCDDLDDILKVEVSNSNQIKAGGEIRFENTLIVELEGLTINETKYKLDNKKLIVMGSSSESEESYTEESCFTYTDEVLVGYSVNVGVCTAVLTQVSDQYDYGMNSEKVQNICNGGESDDITLDELLTNPTLKSALISNGAVSGGTIQTKNTQTITGYTCSDTSISIPSTLGGKTVAEIGAIAINNKNLTSLTLPNTIVTIYTGAFQKNNLTSVTIPNSVTYIGNNAFNKNQLESINLGSSLNKICYDAFGKNRLTSVTIPNSVTYIGDQAFYVNNISTLNLGSGVSTLKKHAFSYNQLTSVTIPNSVTTIGINAFRYNKLTTVTIGNGINSIESGAFGFDTSEKNGTGIIYGPNALTSVSIDRLASEVTIESDAFGWTSGYGDSNIQWKTN